jgi:murein DD-endopeptidase MepM/ murein hydrolase activator NlpD
MRQLFLYVLLCLLAIGSLTAASISQASLGDSADENVCAIANPATTFPSTTRQVFLRFVVSNPRPADQLSVDWIDPSGQVAATAPYNELPRLSSLCLLSQLPVGGFGPSYKPGVWNVRVTVNGRTALTRAFHITGPVIDHGLLIERVAAKEGESGQTALVVEGRGFNSESVVHVAQYSGANGWNYIAHLMPRTVDENRITVQLAALAPAEYVLFVKDTYRLSLPARFLITTAGYRLPTPAGEEWAISQPPYGSYSHWGRSLHAYDIAPRGGSCVVAMRAGIAYAFDLKLGQTPRRRIFGNYITIAHDDGSFSHYAHLKAGTFRILTGDHVEPGQPLALVGNSGYSFGAHVHVHVTKAFSISSQSIPFRFEDLPAARHAGYRGAIVSANGKANRDCKALGSSARSFISSAAPGRKPDWSGSVAVAGWWSELTKVPAGTSAMEIHVDTGSKEEDVEMTLVSPSGRLYPASHPQSDSTLKTVAVSQPEPGTWRISVQGIRGTGDIAFSIYSQPFRGRTR